MTWFRYIHKNANQNKCDDIEPDYIYCEGLGMVETAKMIYRPDRFMNCYDFLDDEEPQLVNVFSYVLEGDNYKAIFCEVYSIDIFTAYSA